MTEHDEAKAAIGRTREVRDTPDALASMRLLDLLGHDGAPIEAGDVLPPLSHWLHFGGVEPYATRGPDGHPARGDFLPALTHLPRRMWAGSRVTFHAPLRAGAPAVKRSTITDVTTKSGRSGPLAFANLRHEIAGADGQALVTEDQTLVFREAPTGRTPRTGEAGGTRPRGTWHRVMEPDAIMLFRYSALTFNSHRIHYDADYVREVEGYADLVIHGPLTATLLLDLARRSAPERTVAALDFRAKAPLMLGDVVALDGEAGGTPDCTPDCMLIASARGATAVEMKVSFVA